MLASSLSFAAMTACAHGAGEVSGDWRFTAVTRAGLVLLLAMAVARMQGVRLIWLGSRTLWVRSLTGSFSMLLTFYALTHLRISTAITLTNTFPLWVALLAWPVLGERPTRGVGLALLGGILGVALIERPDRGDFRWASATALAASVCTAIVMIGLNRLKHLEPLAIVVHFSAVATVVCCGYSVWTVFRGSPVDFQALLRPEALALLAGIAVFATAGQILMTRAFQLAPPQKLAVVGLSQVVFALGFDLLFWPMDIDTITFAGITLVVAPVAWLLLHPPADPVP
jgi:drug/metabolite transporter (DMT)-like permease